MNRSEKHYQTLELTPGASLEEVRQAYRILVKIWHPDRFPVGSPVHHKAQEKLKEINLAYEKLLSRKLADEFEPDISAPQRERPVASAPPRARANGQDSRETSRGATKSAETRISPSDASRGKPARWTSPGIWIAFVVLILVLRFVFTSFDSGPKGMPAGAGEKAAAPSGMQPSLTPSPPPVTPGTIEPEKTVVPSRQLSPDSSSGSATKRPPSVTPVPVVKSGEPTVQPSGTSAPPVDRKTGASMARLPSASQEGIPQFQKPGKDFFTRGSTKQEVRDIQGTPESSTDSEFIYAYSTVHFKNGKVDMWKSEPPVRLKARVVSSERSAARDYFTVGSTKEEVLLLHGMPDSFTDSEFTYGYALVRFKDNKVVNWEDDSTPKKLKARLQPSPTVKVRDTFTIGSTRDEVLAIQGTPDKFTETEFHYGFSIVRFKDGKVIECRDDVPRLKIPRSSQTSD